MSDRPSLLALDAPIIDQDRLRARTGVAKPEPSPSLLSQFWTTAQNAAGNTELHEALRSEALANAYDPIIADLRKRGIDDSRYAWSPLPGSRPFYNPDAIWQGIAKARQADPKAFTDLPPDVAAFEQRVTAPVDARFAPAERVEQQSSWVPWLAGTFLGGASDPVNLVGMATGAGEARSIAQAALREAGANAALTAATEPQKILQRAMGGKQVSVGEVATDIGTAAAVGGVMGGALHGATKLTESVWGKLAGDMHEHIGAERMTDGEKVATDTLTRADEIAATSPFTPGAGTDAHFAKLDAATRQLDAPPGAPAAAPPPVPRFDANDYASRVGQVESGGNYRRGADGSSAYGMYQITRPTWLRLMGDDPIMQGLSDDAKWDRRTNPALQERAFQKLTQANRAALARIGAPETYGNMYLLHFAGESGGAKILRAAPDTPIEQLLGHDAIAANPFLKGKSAGDVVAWAHAKMGDSTHNGALLRRDQFDSDEDWSSAQRGVDDADHALDLAQRDAIEASRPPTADAAPESWIDSVPDRDGAPIGMDWEPDPEAALRGPAFEDAPGEVPREASSDVAQGDAAVAPVAIDGFQTEKGSTYRVEADGTTTRDKAYRPEHGVEEQGPQPTSETTHYVTADDALKLAEFQAQGGSKVAIQKLADGRIGVRYLEGKDAGKFEKRTVVRPEPGPAVGLTPVETWNNGARVHFGNKIVKVREAAARVEPRVALEDPATAPAIEGFDHPDDVAAERQIASMEHDLRALVDSEDGKALTVRLDDEGKTISAADALKDVDDDEAAIDAARRCL